MKINLHGRVALFCALQPGIPQEIGRKDALWGKQLLRTMKLVAIILTACCLQVSAYTKAQVTISVKEVTLDKIFIEIEKQVGRPVMYSQQEIRGAKKVSLNVVNVSVEEVLKKALKGQPFRYEIDEAMSVFIYRVNEKGIRDNFNNDDLLIKVWGKLTDKNGEPVVGATIQVKGSTRVTTSNDKGEFQFENIDKTAKLIITSINYQRLEVQVDGREVLVIQLEIRTSDLAEVNVTISTGYQKVPYNKVTGSVSNVDNKLFNRSVSADVLSRLNGVASGVLFDQSVGNNLGISVRGKSTIFANAQPLIVIDNFPYTGDINSINPNDIESVTILKDAAAASIWGAYSGNGVIVLTTKKGSYNQPVRVEFNSNVTTREKPDLFYDQQFIKSPDFIGVEKYLFEKGFYDAKIDDVTTYPVLSPVVEILQKQRLGQIDAATANAQIQQLGLIDTRDQTSKYLYRQSVSQQYSLNVSGGDKYSNYYLSAGYDNTLATEKGNKNNRVTLNGLMTYRPFEFVELYGGLNFIKANSTRNALDNLTNGGDYGKLLPYTKLADDNGTPLPVPRDYNAAFVNNPLVNNLLGTQYFPLQELQQNDNKNALVENRFVFGLKMNILRGLSAEAKYQYMNSDAKQRSVFDQQLYRTRNLINTFSVIDNGEVIDRNIPLGGILSQGATTTVSNDLRVQLNYNNKWGIHSLTGLFGIDVQDRKTTGSSNTIYGYDSKTGVFQAVDFKNFFQVFPSGNYANIPGAPVETPYRLDRFRSYFGNIIYSINDVYSLSGSARIDQSNLFGIKANQRSVPLWSAGAAWNINKASFYDIKWLELLKLRATYGFNGNLDKSITAITTANYIVNGGLNNIPIAEISSPGNPQLKWERIRIINLGIDFALTKNVLSGSIEYYFKQGFDMIGDAKLPSSSGFPFARGNFSNMRGSGFDITLNAVPIHKKFTWMSTWMLSYTTDKITKNDNEDVTLKVVGNAINGVYTYRFAGLDNVGDPLGILDGAVSKDYASIFNTTATNPRLLYYSGSAIPRYFGSLRNTFSFKGISLSANIIFKLAYSFRRNSISYSSLYNSGLAHVDFYKRWMKPGDEAVTTVPAMQYIDYENFSAREGFYSNSSAIVERGDHIRLQDVSLSYSLPQVITTKIKASSCQVYLYASNLGILWRRNNGGLDPDFLTGYPTPKTYSIGIRAAF